MATLIITPDISAERKAGATGCARGSHACIGIRPALVPKPTIAAQITSACNQAPCSVSEPGSESAPASARTSTLIQTPTPPMWVTAR